MPGPDFEALREKMVLEQCQGRQITDRRVLAAMLRVPRHEFVPEAVRDRAYEDTPLPIGAGQTISQPYMVAFMLQVLALHGGEKVLEIGTGSGYQTALLCLLARSVISVERHASLAEGAAAILAHLGARNVQLETGDGSAGFPAWGPYDRIIVAAAAPAIPQPLCDQLTDGGRLAIPVAEPDDPRRQSLLVVHRTHDRWHSERLAAVVFVPLVGQFGYRE